MVAGVSFAPMAVTPEDTCSICLSETEEVMLGHDGLHPAHESCLRSWFQKKATCPMCRQEVSNTDQFFWKEKYISQIEEMGESLKTIALVILVLAIFSFAGLLSVLLVGYEALLIHAIATDISLVVSLALQALLIGAKVAALAEMKQSWSHLNLEWAGGENNSSWVWSGILRINLVVTTCLNTTLLLIGVEEVGLLVGGVIGYLAYSFTEEYEIPRSSED